MKPRRAVLTSTLLPLFVATRLVGQPSSSSSLLKQEHEGQPAVSLTGPELASLGDPFFRLVLDRSNPPLSLDDLEALLMPPGSGVTRATFVVDERIADASRTGTRRAVTTYRGTLDGRILTRNVMLSVFFDPRGFALQQIEAMGWDNDRGRYNYYKLDTSGTPDGRLGWKFRDSSVGADLRTSSDRRGTCTACHVNGAPVMKELLFPWNNWHSFQFIADYLSPTSPRKWDVATEPRLQTLTGAETLETDIVMPAIDHFNTRRINDRLAQHDADGSIFRDREGFARALEGQRLLAPLFVTTEVNLISARETSGLHPFEPSESGTDAQPIRLPDSLFLNATLIGGGQPGQLGITSARTFSQIGGLTKREYRQAVQRSGARLDGIPGDTHFAWFIPEPSHIDNDVVRQLVLRGILPIRVVAAVLAVDLETPVFSTGRTQLLQFVPETFRFKETPPDGTPALQPMAEGPTDGLVAQLISRIEAAAPAEGTPARLLLDRLRADDPVKLLSDDVAAYHARVARAFAAPATRAREVGRLQGLAIQRRRQMLLHPVLGTLDETQGSLLPIKPPLVRPNRLSTEGHKEERE